MILRYAMLVLGLMLLASPAHAHHRSHRHHGIQHSHSRHSVARHSRHSYFKIRRVITISQGEVIGGRPRGCPSQFCGCGASLYLFGRIRPSLNLAANWLRFPRAAPAPGMAAVRRHHVMVLVAHRGGDVWLVHDSNSGHHLTRLHDRSIAGYAIVHAS